jgi:hypothetical protein
MAVVSFGLNGLEHIGGRNRSQSTPKFTNGVI